MTRTATAAGTATVSLMIFLKIIKASGVSLEENIVHNNAALDQRARMELHRGRLHVGFNGLILSLLSYSVDLAMHLGSVCLLIW